MSCEHLSLPLAAGGVGQSWAPDRVSKGLFCNPICLLYLSRRASLVLLSTRLAVVLKFPAALSTALPTQSWESYYQVMMCQAIARWGKSLKENADVAVEASMVILFSFVTWFSTPKAFKLLLFLLRWVGGFGHWENCSRSESVVTFLLS